MSNVKKVFLPLLIATILLTAVFLLQKEEKRQTVHTYAFDTVINITAPKKAASLSGEALDLCQKYEDVFSRTNEKSELYALNAGKGSVLSDDMKKVLDFSLSFCALTDGAFDISVAPLTSLWNIKERTIPPTKEEIESVIPLIGYEEITLSPFSLGGRQLDLGAVAKGYVADKLTEYFKENNAEDVIIDLGGNVALIGEFCVGIRSPFNPEELFAKITLKDKSAVTSGAYQRYFDYDGKRYHHILDPRTGECANSHLASVTVISPSSMHADALSTAIYILGEDGLSLCSNFPDTDALLITGDGEVITTDGFKEKYKLELVSDNK